MREVGHRIVGEAARVCKYDGMKGNVVQTDLLVGIITI